MVKSFSQRRSRKRRRAGRVKRTRSTEETEQRILDAAHAVFVRAGTAGARTLEIAKEAFHRAHHKLPVKTALVSREGAL